MEEQQKETQYLGWHKDATKKDYEVEKMMRFLRERGMFEEIKRWREAAEISKLQAVSYSSDDSFKRNYSLFSNNMNGL